MADDDRFISADDPYMKDGCMVAEIRSIETETVDGMPALVMYFIGYEKGVLLTRQLADDLTAVLGPSPKVEEFFREH